ncbi:MAG: hypothetical protein IKI15_05595 [Lachnospiraceae bacterium]|nr:hypothetical protein [Lachnospiraceae bacterium]
MHRRNYRWIDRKAAGLLLILLCSVLIAGCGREKGQPGGEQPAGEATPTVTEAVATPTPTVPFYRTGYETVGRDDVYRVPVAELNSDWYLMNVQCAGEYVLLWLNRIERGEEYEQSNTFVLLRPSVDNGQHRFSVHGDVMSVKLLPDGTAILEEEPGHFRVLDNTMTETGSCQWQGDTWLGISEDGLFWSADSASGKLTAVDRNGRPAGEYAGDPERPLRWYLGTVNGQKCFLAAKDDAGDFAFACISSEGGDLIWRTENESDLGEEWKNSGFAPMSTTAMTEADATWFLYDVGDLRSGTLIRKSTIGEQINFLQNNLLCSIEYGTFGGETPAEAFRMYDLERQTISGMLRGTEYPGCTYLCADGVVGDRLTVLHAAIEDGTTALLLWDAEATAEPSGNFCDLTKDDPAESLEKLLQEAMNQGIVITPDRTEYNGSLTSLGDYLASVELAGSFLLTAESDPELLKADRGKPIHPENMSNNDGGSYTFQPHVFSTFYLKEHGEKRRDAFFAYVDALRAGEDSFPCRNEGDANWSSGKYAGMFFPYASLYADARYVGNGRAEIIYKIPKEEFLAGERAFEERIVEILNNVLEDDYTDFEKALALYEFLTEYTVYDYDMMEHNGEEEWMERQSSYRVLTEQQGICNEIAKLYQYLGLQCGIDVDEESGCSVTPGEDSHAWNYINLDGRGYLIDATWGLTAKRKPDLKYFLFTDELREKRDGYEIASYDIGFAGMYGARKKFSFECEDERYKELWEGTYVAFDEEQKCIFYRDTEGKIRRFEYGQ